MRKLLIAAAMTLGTTSMAMPASAQLVGGGLVVVNISNVANNLARDLDVNVQDLIDIGSVQVPIGVAANVCNISAAVLASQRNAGEAACNAETTNRALTQIVQRQLTANNQ
jgi:hypothetical protein